LTSVHSPSGLGPEPLNSSAARCHRIRAGITLETVCQTTKISRYFLEAIEARAYQRLPGGIFDVCYIRQYAEQIGFAAEDLLADYRVVVHGSQQPGAAASVSRTGVARAWWRFVF
jgi:cytoskeletal protein RodZ